MMRDNVSSVFAGFGGLRYSRNSIASNNLAELKKGGVLCFFVIVVIPSDDLEHLSSDVALSFPSRFESAGRGPVLVEDACLRRSIPITIVNM